MLFVNDWLNNVKSACSHSADDIFKCIFLNEMYEFRLIKISQKFVPTFRINNIPSLVQIS